jgi:hypothetical protein
MPVPSLHLHTGKININSTIVHNIQYVPYKPHWVYALQSYTCRRCKIRRGRRSWPIDMTRTRLQVCIACTIIPRETIHRFIFLTAPTHRPTFHLTCIIHACTQSRYWQVPLFRLIAPSSSMRLTYRRLRCCSRGVVRQQSIERRCRLQYGRVCMTGMQVQLRSISLCGKLCHLPSANGVRSKAGQA